MKEFFDDNTAREGHGRKSLRGGILSVASRGVNIFVQVGSQVWVARLLSPDDVGLVAMIWAIIEAPGAVAAAAKPVANRKGSLTASSGGVSTRT